MLGRLFLGFCIVVTAADPAWAQTMTDAQRASIIAEARASAAAGNATAAEARLQKLWGDLKTHDVSLELGILEVKIGEHRDAAEHLTFGLTGTPPEVLPDVIQRAREALATALSKVGVLRVKVDQPGAVLKLDGAPIGVSPLDTDVFVAPGGHYVSAALDGYAPAELTADIAPGTLRTLDFVLQPQAAPATGGAAGPTQAAPEPAPPRKQVVKPRTIVLATGVAVTGAAAVVTTIFGLAGSSARSRERDLRAKGVLELGYSPCSTPAGARSQTCSDLAKAVDDRAAANERANVALAVTAGAGLATLGVLFFWPRDDGEEVEAVGVSPGAGDSPAGLTLTGVF